MKVFKSILSMLVVVTLFLSLIFGAAFIATSCEKTRDVEKWNSGFCQCGNEWEFINGSKSYRGEFYYYYCNNCGNIIDIISSIER